MAKDEIELQGDIFPVKVLIVDDREENLLVLDSILSELGLELIKAHNASDALELLLQHDVAVALIDVQMPEIDGFELAELIRGTNRTSHVPIIFVTAGSFERNRVFRGYEAGAVDFLFKPLVPHILKGKVQIFAEIYRQRTRLAAMVHLREELVAVVSHDLRNPLNSIVMSAALISNSTTDKDINSAAERIERSAKRMTNIIEDLLDLSRTRLGGGIPVQCGPCDLQGIVGNTVEELSGLGQAISLQVIGDTTGTWDSARLSQAISNLLGNAIEHGTQNHPISVSIDGSQEGEVLVRVHNYGVIPAEHQQQLFQPYVSRAKDAGRKGLGLGLYIVSQIAQAHRGDVSVASNAEAGTTFTMRLSRYARTSVV
jgi:two-component system, sensor histidine kinase and response regulator